VRLDIRARLSAQRDFGRAHRLFDRPQVRAGGQAVRGMLMILSRILGDRLQPGGAFATPASPVVLDEHDRRDHQHCGHGDPHSTADACHEAGDDRSGSWSRERGRGGHGAVIYPGTMSSLDCYSTCLSP
jgi:hypothetical protein